MAFKKVLRRLDAPHVFIEHTPLLARRMDVLREAWLNTATNELLDEKPRPAPPRAKRRSRGRPRKAEQDRAEIAEIAGSLDDLSTGVPPDGV